ncbi:HIT domain-containing protein [Geobacter sp. SVR]|uniref:HIT family protein n=1 Tax=Geobacter sp. SVR TaxID=2495594 RepID=UPI00143EFF97|nr:HIT domain-containing protein [Geobacter sp. SVR]BCS53024.1 hydrolase [Geobacter sp. SVR]GCF84409.1 hydrolase [Geobacter sp. SVR]
MERIWAPWRMSYVRSEEPKDGCPLCRARDTLDDREHLVLARTGHSLLMLNRFPYAPGHLMVAPVRHIDEPDDLNKTEILDLMRSVRRARAALRQTARPDGFNIGMNLGRSAGAGIADHLHIHIVPRWHGDTNYMPIIAGVRVIPEGLLETYDTLLSKLT